MLRPIARFVSRLPGLVILVWAAVAAVVVILAPPFDDVVTRDDSAFLSDDAPSVIAAGEASRIWPREEISKSGALVFRRESGLTSEDAGYIRATEAWLSSAVAPDEVRLTQSPYSRPELRDALLSSDGKVAIVVVGFTTPPFQPRTDAAVEAIRAHTKTEAPAGLRVYLTGNAGVAADEAAAIDESVHRTTLITLLLVSAILLWVFRSPVAPLVPLVTIGMAFVVSRGLIAIIAGAGLEISALVETFMVVIVFGVGTDYCLFIVSRYREQLQGVRGAQERAPDHVREAGPGAKASVSPPDRTGLRADDRRRVLVGTMAIIGGVIASSAAAVVVAFASQGAAEFGMFRTTGPAMAIAVIVVLAAGLTLTPALLAVLGRWTFWPWWEGKLRSAERATERAAA